ncbi:MAG: sialate O-acetylesterase [Verrucomicrobia bacterium]|nr:sialate O-acetylesterase [Verrucomicrobiota bacterium]
MKIAFGYFAGMTTLLQAAVLLEETFNYPNGPLSGQGSWVRGVSTPSADNPSNYIVVENGAIKLIGPQTTHQHAIRYQWDEPQLVNGMVYATFDFRASEAPSAASDVRPGFISFDQSGGSQLRGWVGIQAGTEIGTFQLGVSASSQAGSSFVFAERDLDVGITYQVTVGYNIATARTDLWIDAEDLSTVPAATATGSPSNGVRRVQLRLYNSDGGAGTTQLGVFFIDNLSVFSGAAVDPDPEPDPDPVDLVTLPSADKVYLFLLIGQSNMAGRGAIEAEDLEGDPRIAFFNQNRQWQVAREPLHWDRPGFNGVGPALSFARALLPLLPEDAVIGLIPAAQGATPIAQWAKTYSGSATYYGGQYLYPHAVGRAQEAAQVGTLAGILWNQGENDAGSAENDGGNNYRTRLHQLIADLRADLNGPELPFIASTLGPWRANSTAINNVFLDLPNEVPFTATVNTLDPEVAPFLVNNPNDTPHYLSPSYRLLGQLYAQEFAQFLSATTPLQIPVLQIATASEGLSLSWLQAAGLTSFLELSHSLVGPWDTIESFTTAGEEETIQFIDTEVTLGQPRFYRLRLER